MIICADFLGMAKYPEVAMKALPVGWGLGFFDEDLGFGKALPHVKELLKRQAPPLIRAQLNWADNHIYTNADKLKALKRAEKYAQLAEQNPQTTIVLSPFTEHFFNKAKINETLWDLQKAAPNCVVVNNPQERVFSDYNNETHHIEFLMPNKWEFFSFDGITPTKIRFQTALSYKHLKAVFVWHYSFNGKKSDDDKTPREKRKAFPTVDSATKFFKSIGAL